MSKLRLAIVGAGPAGIYAADLIIKSELRDFDVSIESVIQRANNKDEAEIVLITHKCLEESFRGAVDVAERLPVVTGVHNWIRVEA